MACADPALPALGNPEKGTLEGLAAAIRRVADELVRSPDRVEELANLTEQVTTLLGTPWVVIPISQVEGAGAPDEREVRVRRRQASSGGCDLSCSRPAATRPRLPPRWKAIEISVRPSASSCADVTSRRSRHSRRSDRSASTITSSCASSPETSSTPAHSPAGRPAGEFFACPTASRAAPATPARAPPSVTAPMRSTRTLATDRSGPFRVRIDGFFA